MATWFKASGVYSKPWGHHIHLHCMCNIVYSSGCACITRSYSAPGNAVKDGILLSQKVDSCNYKKDSFFFPFFLYIEKRQVTIFRSSIFIYCIACWLFSFKTVQTDNPHTLVSFNFIKCLT